MLFTKERRMSRDRGMATGEMAQYDTIVVGAGIVGSATAYSLARRGRSTLMLDQVGYWHRHQLGRSLCHARDKVV